MKPVNNQINQIYNVVKNIPQPLRSKAISKIFGRIVPYVGTSNAVYEVFTHNKIVVSVKNKKRTQNHIGQVHAVAMTLIAETATGFLIGLNIPNDRINLIKSYNVQFKRPSKGDMKATATLTDEQRQYILDNPKGELVVPCTVTDASGKEPIIVEMLWAWIPKSELAARREGKKPN